MGADANIIEMRDVETDEVVWTYEACLPDVGFIWTRAVFVNDGREVAVSVTWDPEVLDPSLEAPPNLGILVLDGETGEQVRQIDHWACGPTLHPWNPSFGHSYVSVQAVTDEWRATHSCMFDPATGTILGQEFLVDVETGESTPVGPAGNLALGFQQFDFEPSVGLLARRDRADRTLTVTDIHSGEQIMEIADSGSSETLPRHRMAPSLSSGVVKKTTRRTFGFWTSLLARSSQPSPATVDQPIHSTSSMTVGDSYQPATMAW